MIRPSVDAERIVGAAELEGALTRPAITRYRSRTRTAVSAISERFPEAMLVAIIMTLPLQATKTLFPIQQIEVSRLLIAAAIVWLAIRGRAHGWPFPRALTLSIGAMGVVLLASLLSTRWANGVLLVLAPAFYVGFAAFVATTIRDRRALRLTGLAVIASGVLVACVAVVLDIGDVYLWKQGVLDVLGRTNATFGDPNIAARFLIIALITLFTAAALRRGRDWRVTAAIGGCVVLFAVALVLTQSRFGWITLAVILPLLVIAIRPRRVVAICSATFLAAFIVVSVVNGTASGRASEFAAAVSHSLGGEVSIESRGNLTGSDDPTYTPPRQVLGHELYSRLPIDGVRYYLLEAGVAMWEDHPLIGVGIGGFSPNLLGPYSGFIPGERHAAPVSLPHTFVSQLAAENGLVGLFVVAVFVAVIASMAIRASRSRDPLLRSAAIVAGLSVLTIFLSSQVAGMFLNEPYLWLAVGVLVAVYRLVRLETITAEPD